MKKLCSKTALLVLNGAAARRRLCDREANLFLVELIGRAAGGARSLISVTFWR